MWQEINDSGNYESIISNAKSGNLHTYARSLYAYVQSVLIVFRMTGDLALLDHVDVIAEHMRASLYDGWDGTLDGTDGTTDGYLNWRYDYSSDPMYRGKDLIKIDEMGAHSNAAVIAYALEANRDLTSPSGRDYGAHADFWKDYLVNHFEAKWRERTGNDGFPIMTRPRTGTYYKWMRWHYYMWNLTGNTDYLSEATTMADYLWAEIFPIETPSGTAYVWARGIAALGGSNADTLSPTTYARHHYGNIVELHLEGFHDWASEENMRRFARTFTEFIIDTDDPLANGMASDVGGGQTRLHLKSDSSWSRLDLARYRESNYGLFGAWDPTGEINSITAAVQDRYDSKDTTLLASGLFLNTIYDSGTAVITAER